MKTNQPPETVFLQTVTGALADLKVRLQLDYQRVYPELGEIVHLLLDEEEANAWELSRFPHLLLPDLVEAHIEKLNLPPADTRHDDVWAAHSFTEMEMYQPAFA